MTMCASPKQDVHMVTAKKNMKASQDKGKKPVRATHDGTIQIGDIQLDCANLPGGVRVLSESTVMRALDRVYSGSGRYSERDAKSDPAGLPRYLTPKGLIPFISKDLMILLKKSIIYTPLKGGNVAHGVPAEALPQTCEVWLDAQEAGVLTKRQQKTASRAKIIHRGLARVGIVALVDEATGYQQDRDAQELQRILDAYVSKELQVWQRHFSQDFYREVFRLRNWPFNPGSCKRPSVVGRYTNKYIYEQLPDGVLDELRRRNPSRRGSSGRIDRSYKHTQFLTKQVGEPHLDNQILAVMTLMRASPNWTIFKKLFKRAFSKQIDLFPDEND